MYERYIKRMLDVVISIVCLVVLSPVLLLIALAIKIDSKGPVLFKQKRAGKGKVLFDIYKFRTMSIDAPKDVATNDLRGAKSFITRVGKVLRVTSLDELPQLINILKGEMALIGPRPALWNQYDLLQWRDKFKANDVRPGLSGWAQVNGRDYLSRDLEQKAHRDGEYAQNISFWFDLKCVLLTLVKVVNRQGIVEGRESKSYPIEGGEEKR
ncbi:MAG: sugar transferase [Clostridiales bacterium]|nr:sugar transferase [Clostridiales bacterium]